MRVTLDKSDRSPYPSFLFAFRNFGELGGDLIRATPLFGVAVSFNTTLLRVVIHKPILPTL